MENLIVTHKSIKIHCKKVNLSFTFRYDNLKVILTRPKFIKAKLNKSDERI